MPETLEQMRQEIAELLASRERLVLAADSDRRSIERDLHEGVQQDLIALAVNLQLVEAMIESDPPAARRRLDDMAGDVQRALDETMQLAHRIYPPLVGSGGLAASLRSAAAALRTPLHVDVAADGTYRAEILATVYWCIVDVLEHAGEGERITASVQDDTGGLTFEVVVERPPPEVVLIRLRDRVEALGGRLTTQLEPADDIRIAGSIPLSRG